MKSNRPFSALWVCVAGLLVALGLAACRQVRQDPDANAEAQSSARPVHFVAVEEQQMREQLDLGAKILPDPTKVFRVFPPASGRILAIEVKPGDNVTKGQTLAVIDSSDAASARSDYTKATIESERATRAAQRDKVLYEHGAIAEKDYIDSRAQSDAAAAELARAKQRLEVLSINLQASGDRVPLVSPSRGVVLSVGAAPGEFSRSLETSDPLITIADLSTVWVVADVYEKDIAKVQPGKQVTITVDAYPGRQWTGRIESLSGALDPATRTLKVRVALSNMGQMLKPEMFAAAHVDVGAHNAIVVPSSAIIHEGQRTTVFVDNAGKPERRTVTTGRATDGKVEITSGLQAGQQVVGDGAELLTAGAAQP